MKILISVLIHQLLQPKTFSAQQMSNLFNLKQLITRTRIDLFFTSRPEFYVAGVLPVGFSDHSAIFGVRKLHRIPLPPPRIITAKNYRHYDPALFSECLNNIPWNIIDLEKTPTKRWNVSMTYFQTAADKNAPVVTRRQICALANTLHEISYA